MKISVKTLTIAGTTLLLGGNLSAVIPEKYQTILDRNAFGLLPPPDTSIQTNKPVEPPANLKFTGIATIAGERRVFFTIPPKDAGKELQKYISLSEGERDGSLEVVSIAEKEEEVRIRNGGVDMVLSLKKDGFQPAKVAPGMNQQPMPLAPPPPGAHAGSPVYSPESAGGVVATPAMQQASGNPNPPMMEQPGTEGNVQPSSAPGAVRTIPTRTLRVPPVQSGSTGPQSSVSTGNSVVYNPVSNSGGNYNNTINNEAGEAAFDPAMQLAAMKEYQAQTDRNGGYVPIEAPNRTPNPVVAQPPSSTRMIPAPPLPPIPQ